MSRAQTFSSACNAILALALSASAAAAVNFSGPTNYPVGATPVALVMSDLNRDGKLDMVVVNSGSNNVSVLLGNGDGSFQSAVNYKVGRLPSSVATGDFNGDLNPDLAVSNGADGSVSILLGNGDGTLQLSLDYVVGQSPEWVATGDFNGDHKVDLAVANLGDGTLSILLGNRNGTFQTALNYPTAVPPSSVTVGDLDTDGVIDLVTQAEVFIGNGDGTFKPPVLLDWGSGQGPGPVAVTDLNMDGKPDLAGSFTVAPFVRRVEILLGNGDGTFRSATAFDGGVWPVAIAVTDFDLSACPDLATTSVNASPVSVLEGDCTGHFAAPSSFSVGSKPTFVSAGDLNGDNLPDLLVANSADNTVSVLLNNTSMATYTLSVTVNGTGMGVVIIHPGLALCAHSCTKSFAGGTQVTLGEDRNTGSSFAGWSGACSGMGSCSLVMNSDRSVTATFNLTAPPDFSLTASALSPSTIMAGQSATGTVTVNPTGGFNGAVSFTCSVSPSPSYAPTCAVATSGPGATVTVTTVAPTFARVFRSSAWLYALCLPLLGFAMPSSLRSSDKRKQVVLNLSMSVLFLSGLILQLACGGNSTQGKQLGGGTPPGNYTITVNGTSGSRQHSTSFGLTVQ